MCNFKSGIILKNRCVIAQGSDDSHTNLLNELNIEDTTQNAMTKFVRAELLPPNDEWWTNPETWTFCVDQDIVPDWYETDKAKYEAEFRAAVKEWWMKHVLVDKKIDELSSGYYQLKHCEVETLSKDVQVVLDNSSVLEMCGSSSVQVMRDNSSVQEMHDKSSIKVICDNSSVYEMWGKSSVKTMWGNSSVKEMHNNSSIKVICDNSSVYEMWDKSSVHDMYGNSSVGDMHNKSSVQVMHDNSIARDYVNGIIRISSESGLKPVVHEN